MTRALICFVFLSSFLVGASCTYIVDPFSCYFFLLVIFAFGNVRDRGGPLGTNYCTYRVLKVRRQLLRTHIEVALFSSTRSTEWATREVGLWSFQVFFWSIQRLLVKEVAARKSKLGNSETQKRKKESIVCLCSSLVPRHESRLSTIGQRIQDSISSAKSTSPLESQKTEYSSDLPIACLPYGWI